MKRENFLACTFTAAFFAALWVWGQETVTYRPPARDVTLAVHGETILYQRNGSCVSLPALDRRLSSAPNVLSDEQCSASRARVRSAVAAAIDAGALLP